MIFRVNLVNFSIILASINWRGPTSETTSLVPIVVFIYSWSMYKQRLRTWILLFGLFGPAWMLWKFLQLPYFSGFFDIFMNKSIIEMSVSLLCCKLENANYKKENYYQMLEKISPSCVPQLETLPPKSSYCPSTWGGLDCKAAAFFASTVVQSHFI